MLTVLFVPLPLPSDFRTFLRPCGGACCITPPLAGSSVAVSTTYTELRCGCTEVLCNHASSQLNAIIWIFCNYQPSNIKNKKNFLNFYKSILKKTFLQLLVASWPWECGNVVILSERHFSFMYRTCATITRSWILPCIRPKVILHKWTSKSG